MQDNKIGHNKGLLNFNHNPLTIAKPINHIMSEYYNQQPNNNYGGAYGHNPYPPPEQQYTPSAQPQYYYPPPQQVRTNSYSQTGQYQHPSPPPPPRPPTHDSSNYHQDDSGHKPSTGEKFSPQSGFQDVWAAILYWLHLAAFLGISAVSLRSITQTTQNINGSYNQEMFTWDNSMLLLGVCAIGFVLSLIYIILMQKVPGALIKISFFVSVLIYFATAAYYATVRQYFLTAVFAIFGVLYLLAWFWWKSRIPFATIIMKTVANVTQKYYGAILVAILGLLVQFVFSVWWSLTTAGAYNYFGGNDMCKTSIDKSGRQIQQCSPPAKLIVVLVYCCFSMYWTTQLLKNLVHVTVSGVFASYYFFYGTPQAESSPTPGSLKRACTTSFGSVAFGSLLIALFQTVRAIVRELTSNSDSLCGSVLACCIQCLLSWIEGMIAYFNHYAFTQIAIYGKPYCQASKDTWTLIQDRGIDAMINDNLIGNVLTMGGLLVATITSIITYAFIQVYKPEVNGNANFTTVFVFFGFVVGYSLFSLTGEIIQSGTATTFVCLAEDPVALQRSQPELFEQVRITYPQVVQSV
ncbi:putative choline transporter, neither null mutation nor overexpression affects choline transport [Basidiobolus ranarum]|uniref:Protein PNS1 n=1 Tax=Basidiobolus ranarum TaxID=34480 RepID=A0ABR2W6F0_9FUNG